MKINMKFELNGSDWPQWPQKMYKLARLHVRLLRFRLSFFIMPKHPRHEEEQLFLWYALLGNKKRLRELAGVDRPWRNNSLEDTEPFGKIPWQKFSNDIESLDSNEDKAAYLSGMLDAKVEVSADGQTVRVSK